MYKYNMVDDKGLFLVYHRIFAILIINELSNVCLDFLLTQCNRKVLPFPPLVHPPVTNVVNGNAFSFIVDIWLCGSNKTIFMSFSNFFFSLFLFLFIGIVSFHLYTGFKCYATWKKSQSYITLLLFAQLCTFMVFLSLF